MPLWLIRLRAILYQLYSWSADLLYQIYIFHLLTYETTEANRTAWNYLSAQRRSTVVSLIQYNKTAVYAAISREMCRIHQKTIVKFNKAIVATVHYRLIHSFVSQINRCGVHAYGQLLLRAVQTTLRSFTTLMNYNNALHCFAVLRCLRVQFTGVQQGFLL